MHLKNLKIGKKTTKKGTVPHIAMPLSIAKDLLNAGFHIGKEIEVHVAPGKIILNLVSIDTETVKTSIDNQISYASFRRVGNSGEAPVFCGVTPADKDTLPQFLLEKLDKIFPPLDQGHILDLCALDMDFNLYESKLVKDPQKLLQLIRKYYSLSQKTLNTLVRRKAQEKLNHMITIHLGEKHVSRRKTRKPHVKI